jgi:membrane-associated protease RseP (regulator of RpoE activity)
MGRAVDGQGQFIVCHFRRIAMQSSRRMLCCGIGFLLVALLLASPTIGQPPKPGAERGRDPGGAAPSRVAEKPKPEADRKANPFAGKILVVERPNAAFGQWMPIAMEKCEIVDVGHIQLLTGRLIEQPNQPNQTHAGLKVSIPFNAVGFVVEFDNSEEYEEYQGRLNAGFAPTPLAPAVPQAEVVLPGGDFPPWVNGAPVAAPGPMAPAALPQSAEQPAGNLPNWVLPYFDASRATRYDDFAVERLSRETRDAARVLARAGARLFILSNATGDETNDGTSEPPEVIVLLGREWTGGDSELEHAGKISSLQGLYVLGPGRVSDKALSKLREGHPGAEIERRSEARLGIEGKMHPKGLMAAFVDPNSPAARAGLEPQDVIVELAGQAIPDVVTYREALIPLKPGEKVKMKVWRDGETMSVAVQLGRWE